MIGTKLDEIKGYILEGQEFNAQQSEMIEREIECLKTSSERLGRKDWLNSHWPQPRSSRCGECGSAQMLWVVLRRQRELPWVIR
jgi:hypothetical protein